jgi:hypothetical protein
LIDFRRRATPVMRLQPWLASRDTFPTSAATMRAPNRRSRPWTVAGAPAGIPPTLHRSGAVSASGRESCPANSTNRIRTAWDRQARGRPMQVLVPGAGWITSDPTNRSVGGFNLIPVAVARDIRQVTAVFGSFVGTTDGHVGRGACHLAGKRINAAFRQPHRPTCRYRRSEPWPVRPRTSLGR